MASPGMEHVVAPFDHRAIWARETGRSCHCSSGRFLESGEDSDREVIGRQRLVPDLPALVLHLTDSVRLDSHVCGGGHSVSGLMTSVVDSESRLLNLRGLVLLGFPLKGDMEQAAHFSGITHPMLFIQGTDDPLGDADQMRKVVGAIEPGAALHFVESAGHGFSVPGRPDRDVHAELARTIADWTTELI